MGTLWDQWRSRGKREGRDVCGDWNTFGSLLRRVGSLGSLGRGDGCVGKVNSLGSQGTLGREGVMETL